MRASGAFAWILFLGARIYFHEADLDKQYPLIIICPCIFKLFYNAISQQLFLIPSFATAFYLTQYISFAFLNTLPCVLKQIIMRETVVTGDPGRHLDMSMLASEFTPSSELDIHLPSELDTHGASPPGSSPARVSSSVWDYFEYPCLTTNQSYYDGNNVVLDTSDNFQNYLQQSADDVDIQQALSPQMAFPLRGPEGYSLDGKNYLFARKPINKILTH